ncbi:hypothetical protein DXT97_11865 [Agrobacterium tumefaciens]|nr:hypothetical protein [Agrobacterium tumefaciens]
MKFQASTVKILRESTPVNLAVPKSCREDWRRDYDEFPPHSAIGNKVPISLMNGSSAPPPN